jgi:hypothetical protein
LAHTLSRYNFILTELIYHGLDIVLTGVAIWFPIPAQWEPQKSEGRGRLEPRQLLIRRTTDRMGQIKAGTQCECEHSERGQQPSLPHKSLKVLLHCGIEQ